MKSELESNKKKAITWASLFIGMFVVFQLIVFGMQYFNDGYLSIGNGLLIFEILLLFTLMFSLEYLYYSYNDKKKEIQDKYKNAKDIADNYSSTQVKKNITDSAKTNDLHSSGGANHE